MPPSATLRPPRHRHLHHRSSWAWPRHRLHSRVPTLFLWVRPMAVCDPCRSEPRPLGLALPPSVAYVWLFSLPPSCAPDLPRTAACFCRESKISLSTAWLFCPRLCSTLVCTDKAECGTHSSRLLCSQGFDIRTRTGTQRSASWTSPVSDQTAVILF